MPPMAAQSYATSTSVETFSSQVQERVAFGTEQIGLTKHLNGNKLCNGMLDPT
jgi:hypothetical protein